MFRSLSVVWSFSVLHLLVVEKVMQLASHRFRYEQDFSVEIDILHSRIFEDLAVSEPPARHYVGHDDIVADGQ